MLSCRFGLLDSLWFGAARGGDPPATLQYFRGNNCASLAPGEGGTPPSVRFWRCFEPPTFSVGWHVVPCNLQHILRMFRFNLFTFVVLLSVFRRVSHLPAVGGPPPKVLCNL